MPPSSAERAAACTTSASSTEIDGSITRRGPERPHRFLQQRLSASQGRSCPLRGAVLMIQLERPLVSSIEGEEEEKRFTVDAPPSTHRLEVKVKSSGHLPVTVSLSHYLTVSLSHRLTVSLHCVAAH
eukprot:1189661-Prorocentrum_minimum.AAC.1